MPELPDVTVYIENLQRLLRGNRLTVIQLFNPFLLRTAVPPVSHAHGKKVVSYPFDGYWLDIGNHSDYEKATEEFESIKGRLHLV